MRSWLVALFLCALLGPFDAAAQRTPSPVTEDPPSDSAHPPRLEAVHIPSHGVKFNGALYVASGEGLHPTAILVKGMPGIEQNLDLAQAIRRAGWNVLTMHPRGSWGSPAALPVLIITSDDGFAPDVDVFTDTQLAWTQHRTGTP